MVKFDYISINIHSRYLTAVFWDINLCPVPPGFEPSRVRPCINRFLENRGPVTITTVGVLSDVSTEILRGLCVRKHRNKNNFYISYQVIK
ncbi:hypothetical protein CARUB_v10002861mg [Capsella rubella]|uniref:NYN domain-containing protein n=1 Tax=Capsella rubella TaxID=81985 RepID=R0GRV2_9BRAS|nr:hypothetical protein CARUB_v10002861mg [Capsella rubella]